MSANFKNILIGLLFVIIFAAASTFISSLEIIKSFGLSSVVIGIIIGMIYGNLLGKNGFKNSRPGILFSIKYVLRAAIIFYGFRITFQNILSVGASGLLVSITMVISTFLLGVFIGKKVFKLDADTVMLTASGSAICGAAAVLATESVLKSEPYKSTIAVSTVVLFGTLSMFIYPALYHTGIFNMSKDVFGIYVGGSVHEVAQVVVAGNAVSEISANNGVIVKLTRVMLLAPFLLTLGFFLFAKKIEEKKTKSKILIPYFVLGFIAVAGFNSFNFIAKSGVNIINTADTFLLTMAMCALGMETRVSKFSEAGAKPIYLAVILFVWLLIGGFFVTKFFTSLF